MIIVYPKPEFGLYCPKCNSSGKIGYNNGRVLCSQYACFIESCFTDKGEDEPETYKIIKVVHSEK